ncbi:hypothetical protein Sjap_017088 [Stephania japonica]|uniref:Cytochrome P450 n=1 Tax=Stephania japonica TaxID=461633 RepID=A0AAP0NJ08_9MAGN
MLLAMELTYQALLPTLLITFIIFLYFLYYLLLKPKENKKPPHAKGAWPIIGHLHKLSTNGLPYMTLGAMADRYGPAFTIQLGTKRALVVSNWEVAKECFTTNDRAFSSRPNSIALKIMGYNNSLFGFAPYGQYWREIRKIVMHELLSNRHLESLKHIWISEIEVSMKELYDIRASAKNKCNKKSHVLVEMKQWFADLTMNILVRLVIGKRWFGSGVSGVDEVAARRCQRALKRLFKLVGLFMVEDVVPHVEWLDVQGYQREMRDIAKELDMLLQGCLEEHKGKRGGGEVKGEQDFMDVMLSVLKDTTNITDRDADTVNKSTCLTLILAASDAMMVTLTWALSLLLNSPHVLKKAQEELTAQVGHDRHVDESDFKNLVYLKAIIKETLRLYPPGPLSGPRESIEDAVVAGYHVPAGTRLIMNLWKIQRDPFIWTDPLKFCPERFLTTHKGVDVWGKHYELTPFGSGRRACPGIGFALQVVTLTLARLLHEFELKTPDGAPMDMTESAGLTNVKATPMEVLLAPCLPLKLYEA